MAGARRRTADAPEPAEVETPATADAPSAEPAETVTGLAPGTLVAIESITFASRVYEPGQPLPPTFPADVAERRIADGSVARM